MKITVYGCLLCILSTIQNPLMGQNYSRQYLDRLAEEILVELNIARADPSAYARILKDFRKAYRGNQINHAYGTVEYVVEGTAAVDEAIEFVTRIQPCGPLETAKGLYYGARDHGIDQSANCTSGHKGSDGSYCAERVNRYGRWLHSVSENLCYGKDTARQIVLSLIIDDGISSRYHRNNIFDPKFSVCGIYCDTHCVYKILTVITLAGGFTKKKD